MLAQKKNGFTLIELLVVIAIIAVLSTVGMIVYSSVQKNARISKRVQDLNAFKTALETFKTATGFYPNVTTAGTFICVDTLSGVNSLSPTYMPSIPKDPIQSGSTNCYQYTSNAIGAAATPAATDYKLRTNIPSSEMDSVQFRTQTNLIDPDADSTADDNCVVTNTGSNAVTAWAVYTSTNTACNW
jgi:prepilin-type N-terminal cleavage/methylation domain-containing protein